MTEDNLLPIDALSRAALQRVQAFLVPDILRHSIRTFLHAQAVSIREDGVWHKGGCLPLLFTACIFQDFGTAIDDVDTRFEIAGADAAVAFLREQGEVSVSDQDCHAVWMAIALHTTPQIVYRIHPLARIVRLGVELDFYRYIPYVEITEQVEKDVASFETLYQRGEIERVLSDLVVRQARVRRNKAPEGSWPWLLLMSAEENPEWEGVNMAFGTPRT